MKRPRWVKLPNIVCIILGTVLLLALIGVKVTSDVLSNIETVFIVVISIVFILSGIGGLYMCKEQKKIDKAIEEVEKIHKIK
jgi:uncharacterized membrane protein AbrB (regulator of aidB expression)